MKSLTLYSYTVIAVLFGFVSADRPTSCPEGYTTIGYMCYVALPLKVTWTEAQNLCDIFGGDVLEINSDGDMSNVASLFNQASAIDAYWMDANDLMVPGTWKYSGRSGTRLTYTKWASGQPVGPRGSSCAAVQPGTGSWVAKSCTDTLMPICQLQLARPDVIG